MNDGERKYMAKRIPKWESELWSYVSKGDGEQCPLYNDCQYREKCGWCIGDHIAKIAQLLEDEKFNVAKYNFVKTEPKILGRPFQLVEKRADKCLRRGKVYGPPVPEELISQCDCSTERAVEIRRIPLKAYHGAIWRLEDRWIIQLKSGDMPEIQRHTLFHEAFHILAHSKGVPVFRRRGVKGGVFNEALADYFAACILMPREWVREKWAEVKDVDSMAKIFGVLKAAMWIRLRQLGLV